MEAIIQFISNVGFPIFAFCFSTTIFGFYNPENYALLKMDKFFYAILFNS